MIKASELLDFLLKEGVNFFTGVPDSQLKEFCEAITNKFQISSKHIIAPNEGNAIGLAAGHFLATNHRSLVYMQNSGLGNAVNPITSLIDAKVYDIPLILLIGWRGKPGIKDEPQHIKQGEITLELLTSLGIEYTIITKDTTIQDIKKIIHDNTLKFNNHINQTIAFVAEKSVFESDEYVLPPNGNTLNREEAIQTIIQNTEIEDIFVSTTGKISRELYENRLNFNLDTKSDFLTVGSMGHASMIAYKLALEKPQRRVYCLDGDGAVLMHMGTLPLIGSSKVKNLVHIVLNNYAHESVGGMPTIANKFSLAKIAKDSNYKKTYVVSSKQELIDTLAKVKNYKTLTFIEVLVTNTSRLDLIRPKSTPLQNKEEFMKHVANK
jgi:phosphonopyruvate decarboxylase